MLANDAYETPRQNTLKRLPHAPSHVKRLGHCVLNVKDFRESEAWYKSRLGLITSDEIDSGGRKALGAFLRCDRGAIPSDHHTLFLVGAGKPKFNHAAFELADFDDLMCGNDWLREKGRHHEWGVGRHVLGSQILDYWRDPWGHTVEHWTDGDLLDTAWGSRVATVQELMGRNGDRRHRPRWAERRSPMKLVRYTDRRRHKAGESMKGDGVIDLCGNCWPWSVRRHDQCLIDMYVQDLRAGGGLS